MKKPLIEDYYDINDPRGISSTEYNNYESALNKYNLEIKAEIECAIWMLRNNPDLPWSEVLETIQLIRDLKIQLGLETEAEDKFIENANTI